MKLGQAINHTITIEASHNEGFIVQVGCGRFCFTTSVGLLDGLKRYLDDPEKMEKEYLAMQKLSSEAPDPPRISIAPGTMLEVRGGCNVPLQGEVTADHGQRETRQRGDGSNNQTA